MKNIELSPADQMAFAKAIINPPKPSRELVAAVSKLLRKQEEMLLRGTRRRGGYEICALPR